MDVLKARCQFYFEHENPDETIVLLKQLVAAESQDAAAHQNLGTVLLRTQEYESAVVEYREALTLRPGEVSTYCYLGHALEQLQQVSEARACWREALRLQPNLETALTAIARLTKDASAIADEAKELIAR